MEGASSLFVKDEMPLESYEIELMIGSGGYADEVFGVKRMLDDKKQACVDVRYADEESKKRVLNEIDLMRSNEGDSILMIEDVFDFEEHLFLMVGMMDGSVCDII